MNHIFLLHLKVFCNALLQSYLFIFLKVVAVVVLLAVRSIFVYISRVSDQNGVSLLYIMLEIHHSGRETSI